MLVPITWLKEYTQINESTEEFADSMIMSGSNIETVKTFGEEIKNVVVGKILAIKDHEDSDHLVICQVDTGEDEPLQIVTGAPNVKEGQYVPVALHGSTLAGGLKIKRGKLRGVESNGMLCSFGELGFDDKVIPVKHKDGIWILNGEYTPGTDFMEALQLTETVIDFEITPNRPDCLSIIGMARESAATFDRSFEYPKTDSEYENGNADEYVKVDIKKPELCRRYVARVVKDVKIKESPWWLQKRLMFAGMRPINNIVDITNYVLLEMGHPIHAFDIRFIENNHIIVDTAQEGEKFITLDETERTLKENMLLIKDGVKPIAIAGVMGGLNSEVKDDTETIIVEAANFDMDSVRITSKTLGLRTEASSRYEKGMDPNLSLMAADRVCYLIEKTGAGKVVGGAVDNYPTEISPQTTEVRVEKMNNILGTEISGKSMTEILKRLEMKVDDEGDVLLVTPPTVRVDLNEEVDYSEEIARIYGYDKLEMTIHKDNCEAGMSENKSLREITVDTLVGLGYKEIQTYSFVSPGGVDMIGTPEASHKRNFVKLINPLGEENSVMRTVLLPEMMEVLERNYKRNIFECSAFEIGNTFINKKGEEDLPEERFALSIGVYGEDKDFFTVKGTLENVLKVLGINKYDFVAEENTQTYHPGRCAKLVVGGKEMGLIGEIHPDVLKKYGIETRACGGEIDLESLLKEADVMRYYHPLPKYPFINRDISLLVKDDVTVKSIEKITAEKTGDLLESITLFDKYKGKQIPEGIKSLSFNLIYRSDDRTLTDEEVIPVHEKLLEALNEELGAVLRD